MWAERSRVARSRVGTHRGSSVGRHRDPARTRAGKSGEAGEEVETGAGAETTAQAVAVDMRMEAVVDLQMEEAAAAAVLPQALRGRQSVARPASPVIVTGR